MQTAVEVAIDPGLSAFRGEIPVTDELIYMNHASVSPLPKRTADAMAAQVFEASRRGTTAFPGWDAAYSGVREAGAHLLGASADEIAIVKNTSEGLSFVANGLDWRPGDAVVIIEDEFPANVLPWKKLADRGVSVRGLRLREGQVSLDEIDEACSGARLLAISFVQYVSGYRVDLDAVGEICERRGCLLVVDAVQGLGPFAVDVKRSKIHALSASAHKWLLGPEGIGLLYVDSDLLPSLDVTEFGWTNVRGWRTYESSMELREGAARFECGTLNTAGCYGLRASLGLFAEVGVSRISPHVLALTDRLIEGATRKGYHAFTERTAETASGIVSLTRQGVDDAGAARALAGMGIVVSPRFGWLRFAPHFYNTAEEMDRAVDALP